MAGFDWSSLASAVGSLGSSFVSNATSKGAQARAYNYARALQQHQYDLTIQGYKDAPSAQREGLTSAGYNPMLALNNVGSGASVAGGTPVSANATDTSGIQNAISTAVQLTNQTKQTEASADEAYANADKAKAEKATIMQRLPYVSEREKAELRSKQVEAAKLENDIHYQNEMVNYYKSSLSNAMEIVKLQVAMERFKAIMGLEGIKYSSDKSYEGTKYSSDSSGINSQYSADRVLEGMKYRSWSDHLRNAGIGVGSIIGGASNSLDMYEMIRLMQPKGSFGFR